MVIVATDSHAMSGFGTPGKCVAEFNLGKKRPCDQNASPNADRRMPGKGSADAKMHARTHTAEMYQCCAPIPFSLPEMCCPDGLPRDQANGPHGPGIKNGIRIHTVTRLPTTATRNSLNCLRAYAHAHARMPPRTNAYTNKGGDKKKASQTIGLLTQYCA